MIRPVRMQPGEEGGDGTERASRPLSGPDKFKGHQRAGRAAPRGREPFGSTRGASARLQLWTRRDEAGGRETRSHGGASRRLFWGGWAAQQHCRKARTLSSRGVHSSASPSLHLHDLAPTYTDSVKRKHLWFCHLACCSKTST